MWRVSLKVQEEDTATFSFGENKAFFFLTVLEAMWGLGFRNSRHRVVSLLGSLCECKVGVFQSQLYKMGPILLKSRAGQGSGFDPRLTDRKTF